MTDAVRDANPKVRGRLVARKHAPAVGTPCYDEDLDVPHGNAHRVMVYGIGEVLAVVADEAGLMFLSDQSIWYLHPETDEQKVFFNDWVIARAVDRERITANDVLVVIEVVTTSERKKEIKDTVFQKALTEYNSVPEFGLVFPEEDDSRALTWHRLVDGRYDELAVAPGGSIDVLGVPGLALRVRPRSEWSGGKIEVYFRGEERAPLKGERARAEQEKARAEQEKTRAEQEKARAEQEKARAEQEKARAEQEKARAERLAERLRALGLDPEGE